MAAPGSTLSSRNLKSHRRHARRLSTVPEPQRHQHGGTALSAGVVAQMLQANPDLTPNAVKAILQYTAQAYPGYDALHAGCRLPGCARRRTPRALLRDGNRAGSRMPVKNSMWGQHIVWGNDLISGGYRIRRERVGHQLGRRRDANNDNIVWGTAVRWHVRQHRLGNSRRHATNIVWGTACREMVCGQYRVGALLGHRRHENIVWGTDCGGDDATNVVWGAAGGRTISSGALRRERQHRVGHCERIDNIVWGTANGDDNIVWGTADGIGNIVWGTAGGGQHRVGDGADRDVRVGDERPHRGFVASLLSLTDAQIFALLNPPPTPVPPGGDVEVHPVGSFLGGPSSHGEDAVSRPFGPAVAARDGGRRSTHWHRACRPSTTVDRPSRARASDASSLHDADQEASRFISAPPTSVEGFERFFIAWTLRQRVAGTYACFAVTLKGFDTAIGIFQYPLERDSAPRNGASRSACRFWGSGVFQHSAELVLQFAFETLGVHRLEARAAVANGRGNGALLKVGAVQEAVLARSLALNGGYLDQSSTRFWRKTGARRAGRSPPDCLR